MKLFALPALAVLLISANAFADKQPSRETRDFVKTASVAGTFEIESSKIALDKTQKTEIRKFAEEMIADHTKANETLKATLAESGTNLKVTEALDARHQRIIDNLKSASGDDFNRQYVEAQVEAHADAVKLFSDYSKTGDDELLREFAKQTLPTLERHRDHVKELKAKR